MISDPMTCTDLEQQLGAYLEGDLDGATRDALDRHRAGCPRCAALLADLEGIAADAAALPVVAPTRDLWAGVDARIDAPVLRLADRAPDGPRVAAPTLARRWTTRWPLAAAAAALVAVTAGVTHELTVRAAPGTPGATPVAATTAPTGAPAVAALPAPDSARATRPATGRATARATGPATPAALVARRGAEDDATGEAVYDEEIAALRIVLQQRRGELDSATVVVLEQSLEVIDAAIAQSRAALAADPRSRFLGDQLGRALDRKVELLRTAVALSGRSS